MKIIATVYWKKPITEPSSGEVVSLENHNYSLFNGDFIWKLNYEHLASVKMQYS